MTVEQLRDIYLGKSLVEGEETDSKIADCLAEAVLSAVFSFLLNHHDIEQDPEMQSQNSPKNLIYFT